MSHPFAGEAPFINVLLQKRTAETLGAQRLHLSALAAPLQ
jgi:hypothetical protein